MLTRWIKKQKAKQRARTKAKKKGYEYTWKIREVVWSEDVHEDFNGEEIKDVMETEGERVEVGG